MRNKIYHHKFENICDTEKKSAPFSHDTLFFLIILFHLIAFLSLKCKYFILLNHKLLSADDVNSLLEYLVKLVNFYVSLNKNTIEVINIHCLFVCKDGSNSCYNREATINFYIMCRHGLWNFGPTIEGVTGLLWIILWSNL